MDEMVPSEFYLSQNYPNPFREKTVIKYCVPEKATIKMIVLDPDMTIVQVLENEIKEAGTYEVEFDGTEVSSGVYFYQLRAKDFVDIKKMDLIK